MEVNCTEPSPTISVPLLDQFFTFSLIIEGAPEKAPQFFMPWKSIYNNNVCFDEKCVFFKDIKSL